jgi:Phasin protein
MAKTHMDDMRAPRAETQISVLFDPSRAFGGMEPLLQVGNRWVENWAAMSSELIAFGRTRLDRNIEAGKAFARSSSLDEAMDVQADFTRAALREFFAEAGKIADLGTRAMLESLRAWQPASRGETAHAERPAHGETEHRDAA